MAKDMAIQNAKLPAHLQGAVDATDEFAGGVQSGFPVISYRGRVWRVKIGGEEQVYTDENEDAVSSVELVLLRSNPKPSKIHYDKKYEEGDDGKPRCWSPDGIKPDAEVENPIHSVCGSCPMNQWGSRITENGKKSRACSDVRRAAVVFAQDLRHGIEDPKHEVTPMLLRVPPASLNPLKDYAKKVLGPKGIQPYMLVTRVGFDNDADYPKLTFRAATFLDEDEYNKVLELRDSEEAGRILNSTTEYSSEGTTDDGDEPDGAATPDDEAKSAPSESSPKKKAPKKKAPKQREVTAAEAEAAAAAAANVVEPDEDEGPAPATTDDSAEEAAEPEKAATETEGDTGDDSDDFDAMLNSILGDD